MKGMIKSTLHNMHVNTTKSADCFRSQARPLLYLHAAR